MIARCCFQQVSGTTVLQSDGVGLGMAIGDGGHERFRRYSVIERHHLSQQSSHQNENAKGLRPGCHDIQTWRMAVARIDTIIRGAIVAIERADRRCGGNGFAGW